MENVKSEKNFTNSQKNITSFFSNGIILDPKTAASLQQENIKSHLKQSKAEGNQEKTIYLKHLLTNKINVPSNQMLSKAGKFYNYRSYGYETIYQQNKIKIADVIKQFDKNQLNVKTDQENDQEDNLNNKQKKTESGKIINYQEKKKVFRSYSPQDRSEDILFDKNQSYKILNTTCLQFKKEKKDKINQLIQKNKLLPNSKHSSAFTRQERERLVELDHKFDNESSNLNYHPIYDQIFPSSTPHKFLPLPSTQRRQEIQMAPDCIIRGNLCEYKIRSVTQEMKKYSDKIVSLLKKLEDIETQYELKKDKLQKDEPQKLRDMLDIIQEKKRLIGEEILENQKLFIQARTEYELLIGENLDKQDEEAFNQVPDKIKSHEANYLFNKVKSRGPLFPEQNVKDLNERLFNNYKDNQISEQGTFYFDRTKERDQLFKPVIGPEHYDHYKQYENAHFHKTADLVHLSKQDAKLIYYTKHDYHAQQNDKLDKIPIDWNKIVEGYQKLSNYTKSPNYTNFQTQINRDKPNSHQIRTIKVNTNFYSVNQDQNLPKFNSTTRSLSPPKCQFNKFDNSLLNQNLFE
ncbi:hypothetical protein ABPG72_008888 [Tetrahymena utriculariae]